MNGKGIVHCSRFSLVFEAIKAVSPLTISLARVRVGGSRQAAGPGPLLLKQSQRLPSGVSKMQQCLLGHVKKPFGKTLVGTLGLDGYLKVVYGAISIIIES